MYLPSIERNEPQPPAPKRPAPSVGRETVLLVEDEDAVRRLARLSLERHGYNVLEAAGGEEAILLSETYPGPIDVLVTDVVMAGMHGGEVSERLRASRPTLKVLFMSGYNDDAVVRSGLVDPPTAFLQKPFDSRILATRIREVLGTARRATIVEACSLWCWRSWCGWPPASGRPARVCRTPPKIPIVSMPIENTSRARSTRRRCGTHG